ncbi:hypothetical protein LEQ06_16580 [Paraclostridium sp. AKS46]|nr:hypothetical protein [Paraclostridium sp. AKS46]
MIGIFSIQLRAIFSKKNVFILVCILFIISIIQAMEFKHLLNAYNLKGNSLDYITYNLGGWGSQSIISYTIKWMLLGLIYIYISIVVSKSTDEINIFVLNRSNNRFKVWVVNFLSQISLTIILTLILFFISYIISIVLFKNEWSYSEYFFVKYRHWVDVGFSTKSILELIFIVFFSGMLSLQMIIQYILIVQEKNTIFIGFIMGFIMLSIGYVFGVVPRIFSPFFYSCTMILNPNYIVLKDAIIMNVIISMISFIFGIYKFKLKNI